MYQKSVKAFNGRGCPNVVVCCLLLFVVVVVFSYSERDVIL